MSHYDDKVNTGNEYAPDRDHIHEDAHSDTHNPVAAWLQYIFIPHSHEHQHHSYDPNLATDRGMRAVKISLIVLLATAIFQVWIVAISGSVALLADTIHNFSDALTAIPLGLAFWLSRRARNSRYNYGYGRAEDMAGLFIVLMIAFSACEAIYQSIFKIFNPQSITNIGWVAAAGLIGFLGNELVAVLRIRAGKDISSAALVADGYHARTDGFTSLAVLVGAIGTWLGFPLLDPIIGLGIGVVILWIVWISAKDMWYRLMDAIDPEINKEFRDTASQVAGVMDVHNTAIRWQGHRLYGEMHITVDCQQITLKSHFIAEEVRHQLFHKLPALVDVIVHTDPCECDKMIEYHPTKHHNFIPNTG